jgi:hypothetical protein
MKHRIYSADGTLISETDIPFAPLDTVGAVATLLAVLEVSSVEDAANAVSLPPEALIAEAEAWAAAQQQA